MDDRTEQLKKLYSDMHYNHTAGKEFYDLLAILKKEGYKLEHGWGVYLHLPDGSIIVMDDWNE